MWLGWLEVVPYPKCGAFDSVWSAVENTVPLPEAPSTLQVAEDSGERARVAVRGRELR